VSSSTPTASRGACRGRRQGGVPRGGPVPASGSRLPSSTTGTIRPQRASRARGASQTQG